MFIVSTFGWNPLANAMAITSLDVIRDEKLDERHQILQLLLNVLLSAFYRSVFFRFLILLFLVVMEDVLYSNDSVDSFILFLQTDFLIVTFKL